MSARVLVLGVALALSMACNYMGTHKCSSAEVPVYGIAADIRGFTNEDCTVTLTHAGLLHRYLVSRPARPLPRTSSPESRSELGECGWTSEKGTDVTCTALDGGPRFVATRTSGCMQFRIADDTPPSEVRDAFGLTGGGADWTIVTDVVCAGQLLYASEETNACVGPM